MTRDEFEKLPDGSTVAYGHPVGTVVRRTATKEIHWPDGVVSRFIGSVGEREFIKDLVLVSTVEKPQPRPLTANEQLLVEALSEAKCWLPGEIAPAKRGAKCDTLDEVEELIVAAIAKVTGQ